MGGRNLERGETEEQEGGPVSSAALHLVYLTSSYPEMFRGGHKEICGFLSVFWKGEASLPDSGEVFDGH